MGNGFFGGDDFFQVGFENSLYKKIVNSNLKQKKMIDCNFYNFSLLAPYPNKFLIVCICILVSMVYNPPYPQIYFFCVGDFFFRVLQLGAVKISIFFFFRVGGSVLGVFNFLFGKGVLHHFLP